jgi:hypothetical protein
VFLPQGEVCKSGAYVEQNAAKRQVLDTLQQCRSENMHCVLAKLPTLEELQGIIFEEVDTKSRGLLERITSGTDCLPHALLHVGWGEMSCLTLSFQHSGR